MAIITNNIIFRNMRGKLGNLVFRQRGGKTIVSLAPKYDKDRVPTPLQRQVQEEFKRCCAYAKKALTNPDIGKQYQAAARKGRSAFNVAFMDAFHGPEVEGIFAETYRGARGDLITVKAIDNFKVDSVHISIISPANKLIEEGNAEVCFNGTIWNYIASKNNSAVTGTRIIVRAVDLAGNERVMEVEL